MIWCEMSALSLSLTRLLMASMVYFVMTRLRTMIVSLMMMKSLVMMMRLTVMMSRSVRLVIYLLLSKPAVNSFPMNFSLEVKL